MPTIYLDVCCLNRPFDDQNQTRIRLEAEAILMIVARCETGDWEWIRSSVTDFEIDQTPDPERRRRVKSLASHARRSVAVAQSETERAQQLESWGVSAFDALHPAAAESGGADIFLTTDDTVLRRSTARSQDLRVRVENPLTWLGEVS